MVHFAGKTALVTGGSSGIGAAIAEGLLRHGAEVVIADKTPCRLEDDRLWFAETDITDADAVERLSETVHDRVGAVDILISNAGRGIHERLTEGDPDKWAQILDINVVGALRIIRAFTPAMVDAGGGDVVFVSSISAQKAYPWGGIYSASKAALNTVAETLRLETAPHLRVITVAPGAVRTPFFENTLGGARPSPPEDDSEALEAGDVADSICFALQQSPAVAINHMTLRPVAQKF